MTAHPPPPLAVLLPVFNAESFVHDAIRSVLDQTFTDFELLVIDDGSTDRSPDILEDLASNDERISVIHRQNRGLVATLNELIARTRAPLLARMDADDICLPERFALQKKLLDAQPTTVCVGGAIELMNDSGEPLRKPRPLLGNAAIQRAALQGRTPLCHPAVMMRREAVLAAGGYHTEMFPAEDLDLFLRLGERGELANVPETVLRYRVHDSSVSVTMSDEQRSQITKVCKAAHVRRSIPWSDPARIEAKPSAASNCPVAANPTASALASHGTA